MTDLTEVRILIVDDNAAWRRFLVEELQKQLIQVVGTAEDGLFAIEQTRVLKPSVILMDVWMPRLNGLEATRAIGKFAPAAQVLVLTNNDDAEVVQAALAAGARGPGRPGRRLPRRRERHAPALVPRSAGGCALPPGRRARTLRGAKAAGGPLGLQRP